MRGNTAEESTKMYIRKRLAGKTECEIDSGSGRTRCNIGCRSNRRFLFSDRNRRLVKCI